MLFGSGLENSVCFDSRQYLNTRLFFVFFCKLFFPLRKLISRYIWFSKAKQICSLFVLLHSLLFFLKNIRLFFARICFGDFFCFLKKASYMRAFQARRSLKLSFRLQLTSMFTLDRIKRTAWSLFANRIISLYKQHHHHHLLYQ